MPPECHSGLSQISSYGPQESPVPLLLCLPNFPKRQIAIELPIELPITLNCLLNCLLRYFEGREVRRGVQKIDIRKVLLMGGGATFPDKQTSQDCDTGLQ